MDNKQITEVFQALNQTSDDYFYILDFVEDSCTICSRALQRFHLSTDCICPASLGLQEVVVKEDFPVLRKELELLQTGKKNFHDMEYRWYGGGLDPLQGNHSLWKRGKYPAACGKCGGIGQRGKKRPSYGPV